VWNASLAIPGITGLPECAKAGNVLRPFTEVRIGIRLPPTVDCKVAADKFKEILTTDPPFGAKITVSGL
jgi:hypothetical protein